MLNWLKFIIVFLIGLVSVLTIFIFYQAYKPASLESAVASTQAIKSGQVRSVQSVQMYHGQQSLVTVFGLNESGEEIALFVNEAADAPYEEVKLGDGITAEQAEELVRDEFKVMKLLHVSLGLEEERPVWEVVFKSQNDKLNYVYLYFEDGQWWKKILNL